MAAPEPEAEAVPRAEADDLELDAIPERNTVLCGARNTVRTLIRIKTPAEASSARRPPVQVACVLDRSGSMSGSKLSFAQRACAKLVKHLDVQDTLHFVTYDNAVRVVFTDGDLSETGKEDLKSQIHAVRPGGSTNLFGGLESAAELLQRESQTDGGTQADAAVKRIFLFSDGCVNTGLTDKPEICRRVAALSDAGITTTTFGIGADFDEPLMRGIAEAGKGRYTFLATAPDIPRLVSKSIHDLLKLYGCDAVLDVRGGAHTVVDKVYGSEADDEDVNAAASTGLLHLGDLHAENERMVLLELACSPPGDFGFGQDLKAAEWMLSYQRNGATVQFSGSVDLTTTSDRNLGPGHPAVSAMFALRRASDLEREVATHLQQRNLAAARDAKTQQLLLLSQTLEALTGSVEEVYALALERVYQRAQRVSEQLQRDQDMELTRRQCRQECDLMDCMSVAGFSDGHDSSGSDIAVDDHDGGQPFDLGASSDSDEDSLPRGRRNHRASSPGASMSLGSAGSTTPTSPRSPRLSRGCSAHVSQPAPGPEPAQAVEEAEDPEQARCTLS